jgi:hypothetical protein
MDDKALAIRENVFYQLLFEKNDIIQRLSTQVEELQKQLAEVNKVKQG